MRTSNMLMQILNHSNKEEIEICVTLVNEVVFKGIVRVISNDETSILLKPRLTGKVEPMEEIPVILIAIEYIVSIDFYEEYSKKYKTHIPGGI